MRRCPGRHEQGDTVSSQACSADDQQELSRGNRGTQVADIFSRTTEQGTIVQKSDNQTSFDKLGYVMNMAAAARYCSLLW